MKKHKSITILLMCMLLLVSVCAGILFGSVNIAFKDILNCLTGADRSSTSYILITTVRIPRLLGGLFAGIGLSCSGVILQGVMNNSLASPSTIGVNSGSVPKDILAKYGGHPTAEALVESAMRHVKILEELDFHNIKISLKSSDVPMMIEAYRLIAQMVAYPLHVGVTEAGNAKHGIVKSAVGIGTLLAEGIGDTIRVSLTGDPLEEVTVAKQILRALGLYEHGVDIISCPTCGRTKINLPELVEKIDQATAQISKPLKIAVMGCAVNGPGEAKEADIGIAGGTGEGILFKKGEIIAHVPEDEIVPALLQEIEKMRRE